MRADLLPADGPDRVRRAASPSGGSTSSSWPSGSGPHCSSTTRTISGRAVAKPSRPGATASPMPPRRSSAWPWPGSPMKRGCGWTSRPAASSTSRSAAGVPASRLVLHGNNKSDDELARALRFGVGRIVVDSFDEIDRLARLAPSSASKDGDQAPSRHDPGHSGSRGPHPRLRPHGPGGLQIRVRPGVGRRRRGRGTPAGPAGDRSRRDPRPHREPGLPSGLLRARKSRCWPGFFAPLGLPELCVGGGLGVAYVATARRRRRSRSGRRPCTTPAGTPGSPPTRVITAEPGRSIAASAAVTLYRVGTIKDAPGRAHLRRRRRRDERQPSPRALRQRLRGLPSSGSRRPASQGGEAGGQALRVR